MKYSKPEIEVIASASKLIQGQTLGLRNDPDHITGFIPPVLAQFEQQ